MSRLPVSGETFGRYVLGRELGHGGMGVVYAAHDSVLGRQVALKLVAPHLARDEEFRTRFAREAATQARLDSSHVVRIYDHGEHDGVLYISTQLIDGVDLASLVAAHGALTPEQAVEVTAQLLAGLGDAHRADVVHRDVKPANVLVQQDEDGPTAYLCDFGIATTAGQGLTRTGQVIGSLPWMAPERHYGKDAGAAGDLYSAGCLFWFALTGAAPYAGSDGEVMMGHLEGLVPQLLGTTPFATKANALLLKALAKDPADRYPSAAAMAADLRGLVAIAPGAVQAAEAAPTTLRAAATRPATGTHSVATAATAASGRKRRWAAPALAVACMLAAVAGGLGVRALNDDPALAQGATSVQVAGQTVTMLPTRTLSPIQRTTGRKAGPSTAAVPDGTSVAEGAVALPGAAGGTTPGAATHESAPLQATTTTGRTQAPAPVSYRCWNGTTTSPLSACGWPTQESGARWMISSLTSCTYATPNATYMKEAWSCRTPGTTEVILMGRAKSAADARGYLEARMAHAPTQVSSWSGGRQYTQDNTAADEPWRFGRYWQADDRGAWLVWIDAKTSSGLNTAIGTINNHCRAVSQIQGVQA